MLLGSTNLFRAKCSAPEGPRKGEILWGLSFPDQANSPTNIGYQRELVASKYDDDGLRHLVFACQLFNVCKGSLMAELLQREKKRDFNNTIHRQQP